MKSDIVLRIEKALKEYTPSKIDGVRIATARGILTAYEIAVKNGLSEAGKVDCIKVCESFMLPPITYGVTNPEEHYITCEKKNYRGDVIKTFKAFDLPTELITICFEIKSTVSDFKSPNGHNLVGDINYYVMPSDTFKQLDIYQHILWLFLPLLLCCLLRLQSKKHMFQSILLYIFSCLFSC
jgi:hypothetical protein